MNSGNNRPVSMSSASSAADVSSAPSDQQSSTSTNAGKKRSHPGDSPPRPAKEATSSNNNSAATDATLVVQTPHTLRLLRLAVSGTAEHSRRARALLSDLSRRSSPDVLWDLLGRLVVGSSSQHSGSSHGKSSGKVDIRSGLYSSKWSERENAAATIGTIAANLPGVDRRGFLSVSHEHDGDGGGDDDGDGNGDGSENTKGLWLKVNDLLDSANDNRSDDGDIDNDAHAKVNKLDTILEQGRLLLSSSEDAYSTRNQDEEDDEQALRDLDESAISSKSSRNKNAKTFLKRRVRLQRQILARRLGLGGILSAPVMAGSSDDQGQSNVLEDMVDDADLLPSKAQSGCGEEDANAEDHADVDASTLARRKNMERRGKKRRRRSADNDSNEGEDEGGVTLRALLVLEMRRSGGENGANTSSSAQSHRNPQTLLATDLLYRTFAADWTVRHGALMAMLALMKSWIVSLSDGMGNSKLGELECFGSWPHDILTRCLCILALDRFGDYSGSTLERMFSGGGGDRVVAPVRETAAQLLSLLLSIAPVSMQKSCFLVLGRLVKHEYDWEVRHGAMLAFKYIVTLRSGVTALTDLESGPGTLDCSCWDGVASLAVDGLSDEGDDVRGASAQVLACYFRNENDENKEPSSDLRGITGTCAGPLWSALLQVRPVSSCAVDILAIFALVMRYNCDLVLETVKSKQAGGSATHVSFGSTIRKMVEFLDFDDDAVKASSLRVVGMIIKPMMMRSISHAKIEGEESLASVTRAFCDLLTFMFNAYFDLDISREDATEQEGRNIAVSAKNEAWTKVVGAISPLLGHDKCRAMLFQMLSSIILRFVGIEKINGTTPILRRVVGSLGSLDERRAVLFQCQKDAARGLALLLIEFDLISPGEEDASSPGDLFLNGLLQALSKSPWPSICESACVLYGALSEAYLGKDGPTNCELVKGSFFFTSMLVDVPPCLSLTGQASAFLRDPSVINACDQILISMVEDHTSALAEINTVKSDEDRRVSADEVVNIWQGVIRAKGAVLHPDGASSKPSVTTTSMRLSSSIAGAAISWGLKDLPIKLTPIIRPLMTSLKNEEASNRLDWTGCCLARLLSLRSSGDSPQVPTNVRDKVLTNVCSVALADASNDSPPSASVTAGKKILQKISRDLDNDIDCIVPFSLILSPIKQGDIEEESESTLLRSLGLLALVSQSLKSESQAYGQIINEMLRNVVNFACSHPLKRIREKAVSVACAVCKSDPSRALQKVVPALLKHLKCIENDKERLCACCLLHDILDTAGTMICPFVRCLLPTAMSLMTDPSEECASLAASSFAALVRVSPLVEKRRDVNPGNADPSELERDSNKVIDHLIHGEPLPPLSLPSSIQACMDKSQTTLRGYQKEGISWLHFLQSVNLNGALCDDMGVGKSLQALVGIALAHSNAVGNVDGALKSLVVCPSTVVGHWMKEAEKFFPLVEHIFKPLMYTGSAKARKAMLEEKFKECNLVVTSYSVLRNDIDALSSISWVYCVLDEGHLLKNPGSATARASRLIKSRHKLILSGTPVQNHVNELWAVFDFLMPNFLGSEAVFTKSFAKPIINGQSSGASPSAIGTSINKLKLLHQTVLPFILRREKQDVMKELPPKVMSDIPCVLSSVQATMYQQFIESSEAKHALAALQRSIEAAHQNGGGGSNSGVDIDQEQSMGRDVLKSLLYLRLLCTHPILVVKRAEDGNDGEDDEREDIAEQLSRLDSSGKLMALKDLLQSASICSDGLTAADNDQSTLYAKRVIPDYTDLSSGDFTQSNEDLSDDLNGEEGSSTMAGKDQLTSKCLIFAQFTESLDIVEEYLFAPHMPSLRYLRIDGQVPLEERTKRVDRFNSDESIQVMLLTTRVGGLGLNLTGADTVVFLESDWNPFSDLQAMDRAHRIGQTKTVNVYRLICSDTIEEKIMRLQSIKMEMSKAIVKSDNSTMYSMGTDRLLDLFTFEDRQVNNGNGRKTTEASKAEGANILDVVSSQEDEYLSLSTERFLRDLLPQKG